MSHKTWGGRFKKSLHPLAAKFNASLPFDHILYEYDIQGSLAHANMLERQGLLSTEELNLITTGLETIRKEMADGNLELNELYEDIHMFIEHHLTEKVGEVGKKLHTGRSRNDQVALDLRLYTRDASKKSQDLLNDLITVLANLAAKHQSDMMPGYTHLQQAQPIQLGVILDAYQQMFSRDLDRFEDCFERMNLCPLGAGAFAGSRLPLDRKFVADHLQFSGFIANTVDAVSDRDFILEFMSACSIMMMHCSRLCEDFIIWSSQEFAFISLDDEFATGSSLMPNKKNPDILELIRGKTGRVYGDLMALLTTMKGLPMAYNKDMQEDKEALFDTVKTTHACLEVLAPFLQSITFNTDKMAKDAQQGNLNATHLLEDLVLSGMSFRDAHHQVGQWVLLAAENNLTLSEYLALNNIAK